MSASDQPIVHTPGPWSLLCDEARGIPRCLVVDKDGGEIAAVNPHRAENAELLAAAPELLAAVELFIECWERGDFLTRGPEVMSMLRDSRAKARGEVV